MGFFQLDDFVIQNLNQGYRVSWQSPKGTRQHIDFDISTMIKHHIQNHIDNIVRLLKLLNDPDPMKICNDNIGYSIVTHYMPAPTIIPGIVYKKQSDADEWRNQQFVLGYNNLNKTSFTYDFIKEYL